MRGRDRGSKRGRARPARAVHAPVAHDSAVAHVTGESFASLRLHQGQTVYASFKATAVSSAAIARSYCCSCR